MGEHAMKKMVFVLEGTSLYVSSLLDKDTVAEMRFFDSISYHLLPFIKMAHTLIADNVEFKVALVLSPIYCDMLQDATLMKRYKESLEQRIEFAKNEKIRLKNEDACLQTLESTKVFFEEILHLFSSLKGELIKAIAHLERQGFVELLASSASYAFLPIYKRLDVALHAQIQMGRLAYSAHFPYAKLKGFCPPFLGFFKGIDRLLKVYGYEYSIVAGSSFLLSKRVPKTGVFAPAMTDAPLHLFATDTNTYSDLVFAEKAYQKNGIYLDNKSDIGLTLQDRQHLSPLFGAKDARRPVGFRYACKDKSVYNVQKAKAQAKEDARAFAKTRWNILQAVQEKTHLASPFSFMLLPSNLLGIKWQEGFIWLEEVFRQIDKMEDTKVALPHEVLLDNINETGREENVVEPFYSSLLDSSYAEELFRQKNDWIYRYIFKATERFVAMANMFSSPTSLNERTLNQAMREVTLMQSSYWALLLNGKLYAEHAKKHFISCVNSFTHIYETLGAGMEEAKHLLKREEEVNILKDADYRFYKTRE